VLSIAADSSRAVARAHFSEASEETRELINSAFNEGGVLMLPLRCTVSHTRHYLGFLRDMGSIVRDAGEDLAELRSGASDRMRMVFSQADTPTSSRN
jgi:hypothetical protein